MYIKLCYELWFLLKWKVQETIQKSRLFCTVQCPFLSESTMQSRYLYFLDQSLTNFSCRVLEKDKDYSYFEPHPSEEKKPMRSSHFVKSGYREDGQFRTDSESHLWLKVIDWRSYTVHRRPTVTPCVKLSSIPTTLVRKFDSSLCFWRNHWESRGTGSSPNETCLGVLSSFAQITQSPSHDVICDPRAPLCLCQGRENVDSLTDPLSVMSLLVSWSLSTFHDSSGPPTSWQPSSLLHPCPSSVQRTLSPLLDFGLTYLFLVSFPYLGRPSLPSLSVV